MRRVRSAGGPAKARLEAAVELRLYLASRATLKVRGGPARGKAPAGSPGPGRTTYVILRTRPCADHASSPAQSRSPHLSQAPAIAGSLRPRDSSGPGALPRYPPPNDSAESPCAAGWRPTGWPQGRELCGRLSRSGPQPGAEASRGRELGWRGGEGHGLFKVRVPWLRRGVAGCSWGATGANPARVGEDDRERWTLRGSPAAKSFKSFFSPVEPCVRSEQPICGRRDVRQQILIGESSR